MSNLSILQRNIIHALDSEVASTAFLDACSSATPLAAEKYALEVKLIEESLRPILDISSSLYGLPETPRGLLDYILTRHRHLRKTVL